VDGAGGSSALPDVPTLRILVDNTDTSGNTLLAGTDIDVFRSTDQGATWAAFNLGAIPAVPVFDLEQNKNGLIFAGTHGRGAYQLSTGPTATPTPGIGASVSSTSVSNTAVPGANVAAGTLTISNTSSTAETVSSVTVTVTNPGVFSSLTLSGAG